MQPKEERLGEGQPILQGERCELGNVTRNLLQSASESGIPTEAEATRCHHHDIEVSRGGCVCYGAWPGYGGHASRQDQEIKDRGAV
jgi:hypothetical protein